VKVETRFYRALIVQDEGDGPQDGYGVVFPDLPGCTSSGDTVEQAYEHAFDALALHIEGMNEEHAPLPESSAFDAPLPHWLAAEAGRIERTVLVPVKLPGRAVRISITMDKGLLSRLDSIAAGSGDTRSGYIAEAVRERMEAEHGRSGTRSQRFARDDLARRQL
jgi:predicted RNase H-like HicB family nuclease